MACLAMHLACAYEYLKNNNIEENADFIKGTLAPDLDKNKIDSHFGCNQPATTLRQKLENKMDILKAAKAINLDSYYNRAYFLHLICDDIFYRFVYSEELEKVSLDKINQYFYDDYDFTTHYIINKYKITIPDEIKKLIKSREGNSKIFTNSAVDKFIEQIGKVDLEKAKNDILTNLQKFRHNIIKNLIK